MVHGNHIPDVLPPSGWVWHMLKSEIIHCPPSLEVYAEEKCFLY